MKATSARRHITIVAAVKPFSRYPRDLHYCRVDMTDGEIKVEDSIAGHLTSCHSLSAADTALIHRKAGFPRLTEA